MKRVSSPIPVGLLCLVFLVGLICLLRVPLHAQAQPEISLGEKKVLILHSFERSMPINEVTDQGIGETLDASGIPFKNQFFEYLDLVPDRGSEYRKHSSEIMGLRYGQRKIDMIITLYAEALQFVLCRKGFPYLPLVEKRG